MSQRRVRPPGRLQRSIYGATKRLEGRTIPLGLAVAAIGIFLAYLAWASVNGVPFQNRYELKAIVPGRAPILQKGDAVRIAGRLAGLVTDVQARGGAREVEMELRPAYAPVGRDAHARVRVKSLIYLTYLEIYPGDLSRPMPENGTIPLSRTGSNVDLLEVVELFDRESRETLSRAVFNAGVGLAGRGPDLNAALADLPAITEDGSSQLQALTSEPGAISRSIEGAGEVARGLGGSREDDIAATLESGSAVTGAVARRSAELGESIELLPEVADEYLATAPLLDPLLDDAAVLSRRLAPVMSELARALPDLNRTLALGDELRRQVNRLTAFLRPVLRAATPVIAELEVTVGTIAPLVRSLNAVIDTLDPYAGDVRISARRLISATSVRYPEGQTAPGNVALRFAPIISCHNNRDPYPAPGEAEEQAAPC